MYWSFVGGLKTLITSAYTRYDFYLDLVNVLYEPDRVLEFYGGRPNDMKLMSPQVFFGVSAQL